MSRENDATARDRILKAAGRIFAERGFAKAPVRDICHAADVNVAAINYYFTNKENLYVEVVRHWQKVAFEKFPFDFAWDEANPPEARLKDFIQCQLMQTLDREDSPWFSALMTRESAEPSRAIEVLVEDSIGPSLELLFSIVKQLAPPNTPDSKIHMCCASILGQCTYYHFAPHAILKSFAPEKFSIEDINAISEHIYGFSLAAIQAV